MTTPYYQDELVTLWHGDCLAHPEWWMGGGVMVTDPPYGIAWRRGENKARASKAHAGIFNDATTEARDDVLSRWGDKPAVVFGSLYAPPPPSVRHIAVWEKPADAGVVGSTTGLRRDVEAIFFTGRWPKRTAARGSVFRSLAANIGSSNSPAGRYGHPHAKPTDLMEELIAGTPDGVVVDPFAGSGSTLVAARNLGRQAVGVELDAAYCETIARRLAQGALDLGSIA